MSGQAVIYCRISHDATEEGLGVDRQEDDCRKKAAQLGLEVTRVYVDNDRGASNLSKKARPEYAAMLDAVRAGDVGTIIAYSNSRLTRRPREWLDLIALADTGALQIVTCQSGTHDLTTANGRAVAITVAAWDAAEAERTGELVRRAFKQNREQGKPRHNRYRTYGFDRDFSLNVDEAERVRDAYRRVIAGESVQSIVERWKSEGVVVGGGKTLYHSTVTNIIKNPLYKAVIQHKGEEVAKANVPEVVSEAVWNAAQTALAASGTARTGRYARRYLLGGIVACGLCGFAMPGKARKNKNYNYECSRANGGCGKQGISGKRVEPLVLAVVRQSLIVGFKAPAVADYSEEIKALEEDIGAIQAGIRDRTFRVIDYRDTLADLSKQLSGFRDLQDEVTAADTARQFDDWDSFLDGTIYEQVATIRRHIKGVVVEPAASKAWNPARVNIFTVRGAEMNGADISKLTASRIAAERTRREHNQSLVVVGKGIGPRPPDGLTN